MEDGEDDSGANEDDEDRCESELGVCMIGSLSGWLGNQ
jgi:hypothetical protein